MIKIFKLNFNPLFFLLLLSIYSFSSCRSFLGVEKIDPIRQIEIISHQLKPNDIKTIGFILLEEPTYHYSPFYSDEISIYLMNLNTQVIYHKALETALQHLKINPEQILLPENLSKLSETKGLTHIALLNYKKDHVVLEIISTQEKKSVFKMEMKGANQVREGHLVFSKLFFEILLDPQAIEKNKRKRQQQKAEQQKEDESQPIKTMI